MDKAVFDNLVKVLTVPRTLKHDTEPRPTIQAALVCDKADCDKITINRERTIRRSGAVWVEKCLTCKKSVIFGKKSPIISR